MRFLARFFLVFSLALLVNGAWPGSSAFAQYELVWEDEFNGTEVDPTKWEFQIGTGCPTLCGWGNNELQYYRRALFREGNADRDPA